MTTSDGMTSLHGHFRPVSGDWCRRAHGHSLDQRASRSQFAQGFALRNLRHALMTGAGLSVAVVLMLAANTLADDNESPQEPSPEQVAALAEGKAMYRGLCSGCHGGSGRGGGTAVRATLRMADAAPYPFRTPREVDEVAFSEDLMG